MGSALETLERLVRPALAKHGLTLSAGEEREATSVDGTLEGRAKSFALEDPAGLQELTLALEATWQVSSTSVAHRHTVLSVRLAIRQETVLLQEMLRTTSTSVHGPWVEENARLALERELTRALQERLPQGALQLASLVEQRLAP